MRVRSRGLIARYALAGALALLVPIATIASLGLSSSAQARTLAAAPKPPHLTHHLKPRPHHTTQGVNRAHLPVLPQLAGGVRRAASTTGRGAFISANVNPQTATTLFFDDFESGATGWTTVGDNATTPYYTTGHDFWNLANNPQSLSVPNTVNPALATYPDTAGSLPGANSGTHAWWYGDNPAADTNNPPGASDTYMGNQSDWPGEMSQNGGTSNGPNSASLISPAITLPVGAPATLTFATWWEIESVNPAHFDMMYVDVSANGGATWQVLGVLNPSTNPAGGADAYPYTNNGLDTPASWRFASADLTPYAGSTVQVRFRFDSVDQYDNGFRGWLVDDVGVYNSGASTPRISAITPNSGSVGTSVVLAGAGFGATQGASAVTFDHVTATVTNWSDTSITATVPSGASSGPLVVSVNGASSAAVDFTIPAQLNLASPTAMPNTQENVSGTGFVPGESITLALGGATGSTLATVSANSSGNLPSTSFTVPAMPGGDYLLLASGQTSHTTAGATLTITPALVATPGTLKPGQTATLTGYGFSAYEAILLQLDNTSAPSLAYFSCDATGSCSGSVAMPTYNVLQGAHSLIATGQSSGTVASGLVTFTPSVVIASPTNSKGGPGTSITVSGAAFAANESVRVYWGTASGTSEGTFTTDQLGNLTANFSAPTALAPGGYTITVARTKHKPATLTAKFTVVAPALSISPGGIKGGQSAQVTLSGFQAGEIVNLTWNANGGQTITSLYTDYTGALTDTITPPSAPHGSYIVTATGGTSGLQATQSLNLGPGISLNPNTSNPGSAITVAGGGFTANETLNIYFQATTNGVTSVTTDSTGAFTTTLTVPLHYSTTAAYYVHAVNATSTENVKARFIFSQLYFYSNYSYVNYGDSVPFYGSGFASNEKVNVVWNYNLPSHKSAGMLTADAYGNVSGNLTIPTDPNLGTVPIAAIGQTSNLTAQTSVYEYAALVITPSSGSAGTVVSITGGGFASGESVTVVYQPTNTTIATLTANSRGGVPAANFTIPTGTALGNVGFTGTGATSGVTGSGSFTVTPTLQITPTTGPAGISVTVTGQNYTANDGVYLYWYDPTCAVSCSDYLGFFATDSTGAFTTTITAPSYVTAANTYYVQGYDGYTNLLGQAVFTGQ